jgi:hypothetical protein
MKKEFVTPKIAKELNLLGFNELCLGTYYTKDGDVRIINSDEYGDAPLWQQAILFINKLAREKELPTNLVNTGFTDLIELEKEILKAISILKNKS